MAACWPRSSPAASSSRRGTSWPPCCGPRSCSMKLGDTEAVWAEQGCGDMFSEVKDFIIRCISEDPSERIEAEEAVSHPIFSYELSPSDADLTLLPTPTLKFSLISPVISLET